MGRPKPLKVESILHMHYDWHGMMWTVDTYVMADQELAFPIIFGLGIRLHVGEHSYELCINGWMTVFPFLCQPLGKN